MHDDNYLQLKNRSKDIIISGGENISSIEIENCLYNHTEIVSGSGCYARRKMGESPCAFVGLTVGSTIDEAAVIAFCRENLAHFKAPKKVVFGELPKTSTGKIQKFKLREQIQG